MSRPWMLVAVWVAAGIAALLAGLAAIQTVRTAVGEPVAGAGPAGDAPLAPAPPTAAAPAPSPSPTAAGDATAAPTAPASASGSPAPPAGPSTATLTSAGGTVVASCSGAAASLLAWSPAPGYSVDEVGPGPAAEAEVRFLGGGTRVQVAVTCGAAGPEQRVRVSADGGGDSGDDSADTGDDSGDD